LNSLDLINKQINIIFTSERHIDAQSLYLKYSKSGAKVNIIKVQNDNSTKKHLGKIYYFSQLKKVVEIATEIAKDLREIERLTPQFIHSSDTKTIIFSVWLVEPLKFETLLPKLNPLPKILSQNTFSKRTPLIECPTCFVKLREKNLSKHLLKNHAYRTNLKGKTNNHSENSNEHANGHYKDGRIILFSRRGTRINQSYACDSCMSVEKITWRYAESSKGSVRICGRCKSTLFNRSFGSKDAMNLAFKGGAFESNRRKH
jgi:hypothetical protein